MTETPTWRYYAAVFASLLSSLGWLGAVVVGGVAAYRAATGASVGSPLLALVVVLLVAGIVFARVERLLYRRRD
jgi:membrane protein YdbS with pleckstrin-like domain